MFNSILSRSVHSTDFQNYSSSTHSACLEACKRDFQCTTNPCDTMNGKENLCSKHAKCIPAEDERSYACKCRDGYVGDGHFCNQVKTKLLLSGRQVDYCATAREFQEQTKQRYGDKWWWKGHPCSPPCECRNDPKRGGFR